MATASTSAASSWWQARQHQWQAWPSVQKWRTLTLAGAAIALGIVGLRILNAPHWTPVYTQVTPASAGAMSRILKSQQIPYTLAAGGTSLLVPSADVNQARVDLAEHGLPATNTATLPKAPKFSLGETNSEVNQSGEPTNMVASRPYPEKYHQHSKKPEDEKRVPVHHSNASVSKNPKIP